MNAKLLLLLSLLGSSLVFAESSSSSSEVETDAEESSISASFSSESIELQSKSNSDQNENEFEFSAALENSGHTLVLKVESKNSNGDSENETKLEARIGDYVVYVDSNADGKFSDGDTAVTTYNQWVWSDFNGACTTATNGDVSCLITGTDSTTSSSAVTLSLDLQVKGSTWTQGSFSVPPNAVQFTVSSSGGSLNANEAIALCIRLDTESETGLSDDDSDPEKSSVNTGAAGFAAENSDDNGAVENSDVSVAVRRRDSSSSSSDSDSELSKLKCYSFSGNTISNWDPVMTSPASALVFSLLALVF